MKKALSLLAALLLLSSVLCTVGCSGSVDLKKQPVLIDGVWEFTFMEDGGTNSDGEKNTPISSTTYGVDASGNIYVRYEISSVAYERVYVNMGDKRYEVFEKDLKSEDPEETFTSSGVQDFSGIGNIGFPSDIFQWGVCQAQYMISAEGYAYEEIDSLSFDAGNSDNAILTMFESLGCKYYKLTKAGKSTYEVAILPESRMMLFKGKLSEGGYEPIWIATEFSVDHTEDYGKLVK